MWGIFELLIRKDGWMEYWSVGVMEYWSDGGWSDGVLGFFHFINNSVNDK